jgi:uncharacterized RDD family membrane protein YckC
MSWYYALDGEKVGPISKTDLQNLVRSKQINARTKVWRPGLENWVELGRLLKPKPKPEPGQPTETVPARTLACAQCGEQFVEDDMLQFDDTWVCAQCKPVYLQKLKEGLEVTGVLNYAGFWIRFGAYLIDYFILMLINLMLHLPMAFLSLPSEETVGVFMGLQVVVMLLQVAVPAVYTTWFLGKYGATPGKMACKLKVVTAEGEPISYARALGRHFATWISAMILLIGFLMAAFDDQKRTLHDRICDTRVVHS